MPSTTLPDLTGPAIVPPEGVVPDFEHPGGRHAVGYVIVFLGVAFSSISAIAHLANRALSRRFGAVELWLVAAWGQYLGFQVILYRCATFPGIGRHQWNYQLKDMPYFLHTLFIADCLYSTCMLCLKSAILLNWLHLFVPDRERNGFFWAIHIVMWCNIIFYTVGEFIQIFHCRPIEKNWNPFYQGGSCRGNLNLDILVAVWLNLASDLVILALPQYKIWRLRVSAKQKVAISMLFVVGIGVCILGLLRLISLLSLVKSQDQIYWLPILGVYSSAEVGVGFLIIGLPALPKIFKAVSQTESLASLLRMIFGRGLTWSQRPVHFVQSVRRAASGRRRGLWEITELEETESESHHSTSATGGTGTAKPEDERHISVKIPKTV